MSAWRRTSSNEQRLALPRASSSRERLRGGRSGCLSSRQRAGGLDLRRSGMIGAMKRQAGRAEDFAAHLTTLEVNGAQRRPAVGTQRNALAAAQQAVLVVYATHLNYAAVKIVTHLRAVLYHLGSPVRCTGVREFFRNRRLALLARAGSPRSHASSSALLRARQDLFSGAAHWILFLGRKIRPRIKKPPRGAALDEGLSSRT
jgi:hypothetical protein